MTQTDQEKIALIRAVTTVGDGIASYKFMLNGRELSTPPDLSAMSSLLAVGRHLPLALDTLENLVEAGHATRNKKSYTVPLESFLQLDPVELLLLDARSAEEWKPRVRVGQALNRCNPNIRLTWTDARGRYGTWREDGYEEVSCGFWHEQRQELWVLPQPHARLREVITQAPQTFRAEHEEYRFLAQVQEAMSDVKSWAQESKRGGYDFDPQLEQEVYLVPDRATVELRPTSDGGLELRPIIEGFDTFEAAEALTRKSPRSRALNTRDDQGRRVRVAMRPEVNAEVHRVLEKRHIPAEQVADFARDPRAFIQPLMEREAQLPQLQSYLGAADADEVAKRLDEALDLTSVQSALEELGLDQFGARVTAIGLDEQEEEPPAKPDAIKVATLGNIWSSHDEDEDDDLMDPELVAALQQLQLMNELGDGAVFFDNLPSPTPLKTADNTDELNYLAKLGERLRKRFAELGVPSLFKGQLFPHQEEGYVWLRELDEREGEVGGLLADDMGLGKTIQIIALIAYLVEHKQLTPTLLVVPKTLLTNWERELERFCDRPLRIYSYGGPSRRRDPSYLATRDVILTTYHTMSSDQLILGQIPFKLMLCDEAQNIKNYTTRAASAARAMNARRKIAMTATPVENNLTELWSIMDFAQPGLLGSHREFRERFAPNHAR